MTFRTTPPIQGRSGPGEAAARRARRLRPPPGRRAADQGAALRRRFAGGGDLKALAPFVAGAEPPPRPECRPGAARFACAAAGNRADSSAARAHVFARRRGYESVRGRKVAQKRVKLLKSLAGVNLWAGVAPDLAGSPLESYPSIPRIGLDIVESSGPYWVRWPDCVTAANSAARSWPRLEESSPAS